MKRITLTVGMMTVLLGCYPLAGISGEQVSPAPTAEARVASPAQGKKMKRIAKGGKKELLHGCGLHLMKVWQPNQKISFPASV